MNRLLPYFVGDSKETPIYLDWFTDNFLVADFQGVEALVFAFLDYCNEYGVKPSTRVLEYYLKESGKSSIRESKIYPTRTTPVDYSEPAALEESFRILSNLVIEFWNNAMREDTDIDFVLVVGTYMRNLAKEDSQKIMMENFSKLGDGSFVFEDFYSDVQSVEVKLGEDRIDDLVTRLITEARRIDEEEGEGTGLRFLFKTGVPAIDNDMGGVYSKQLWAFSAQPGGGKTRHLCANYAWRAAVEYKKGVLLDELELTKVEVENIMISHHIVHLYGGAIKIPDNLINKGDLSDKQKEYVNAARLDLFESGKYGRIIIRERDINVSKFKSEMLRFFKMNPDIEVYLMDYVGLAEDEVVGYGRAKMSFECIRACYKIGKWLAKKMDIAVIYVNQYTKEGIEKALRGDSLQSGDIEGGQIVHRHSDYVYDITYTDEQHAAFMRMFSTSKVRSAVGFRNVPVEVALEVSIFKQIMAQ